MLAESLLWVYLDAYGPHWVTLETSDFATRGPECQQTKDATNCSQLSFYLNHLRSLASQVDINSAWTPVSCADPCETYGL